MPLYEYECKLCHRRTEKIQKFSDPEITACPQCGGPLERVISAAAVSFKGGGWFADGYGNAKPSASGNGSKGDSGAPSGVAAAASKESSPASPSGASAVSPSSSGSDKK